MTEQKGFFPYDYFTSVEQLGESTIKNCNVLKEEQAAFQKLVNQGKSEQEALQALRLPTKPKTGPENCQRLQQLWVENQWSTFADYLKWYNDLDVTPMIQAIENINEFYKNICIDFIHQAILIPGIAMRVYFNSIIDPAAEFNLFNPKNKDIYHLFKESIVGGPSIIFNRYHEAGKTFIINNPNIIGYDANALYLWAIGENFPAGYPLIRRQEKFFVREFPQLSGGCRDWIDWLIHERNIDIQSAFHGGEKKIGSYKVDGFCQELNTVSKFYGDYWHCHPAHFPDEKAIHPTVKDKNDNPMTVKDIRARDHQRVQDIQDKGYTIEIIWGKDWQAFLTQRPEIKDYLAQHRTTYTHFKKYLTQDQIIQCIKDGRLFGFVECDIEVPDQLKEYFSEMTPIFKNHDVSLDDVGEFMQNCAKEHCIKDVPRRLLIGSYFGKKVGLSTPLLKWYLEHGLVVTCIYTVIEYIHNAAFNSFMMQVAQARLDGDHDKDKALIAETIKLIGNSSYGKLITNKEKHHDIVYINESEIGAEIMDNHFYSLTELPNG